MIVAVPAAESTGLNSAVSAHFGRAPWYALINTETGEVKSVQNGGSHFGGPQLAPEFLRDNGAEAILCAGLGTRAIMLCSEFGIPAYVGDQQTVGELVEAFKNDQLRCANPEDGCGEGHEH